MKTIGEIWKDWKIDKPFALQIGEWDDWNSKTKAKYPVRWFIQETIPDKIHSFYCIFYRPINRWYWKFMHRFVPRYRYNVVKPRTLKPNYYDPGTLILHSSMECLVDYYEHSIDHVDWTWEEKWRNAHKELIAIYKWWTEDYPNRDDHFVNGDPLPKYPELPDEWGWLSILNEKYEDEPLMKEHKKISKVHMESEEEWYEKTEEMLIRLMKIRTYLWH